MMCAVDECANGEAMDLLVQNVSVTVANSELMSRAAVSGNDDEIVRAPGECIGMNLGIHSRNDNMRKGSAVSESIGRNILQSFGADDIAEVRIEECLAFNPGQ